jgi:hypothetical protein
LSFENIHSLWEAGKKLWERTSARTIYTNNIGGTLDTSNTMTLFSTVNDAELAPYLLETGGDVRKTINFVHGIDNTDDLTLRSRTVTFGSDNNVWKLGDVINSTPRIVASVPLNKYDTVYNDTTYKSFIDNTNYKNRGMVFTGGNDGMLHAFKLGKLELTGSWKTSASKKANLSGANLGDESWAFISGGFGEARIGSIDDALAYNCVLPPGGTANFSAFSPFQWAANTVISNPACVGVDETDGGDAQKLLYFTPVFSGFQLSLSYTPDGGAQDYNSFGGPHVGMSPHGDDASRHNFAAYLTYAYEGEGWDVTWGGGVGLEGKVESSPGPDRKKQEFYQTGLNFNFGNFAIGGVFEYFNDAFDRTGGDDDVGEVVAKDVWTAGGGIAYTINAWTIGAQYSHLDADTGSTPGLSDFTQDRVVLTGIYSVGPGIDIDAEIGYTWVDTDPEGATNADGIEVDGYNGLEFGIGTALTF